MISYSKAPDVEEDVVDITRRLELNHIDLSRVVCIRSFGSKSRRTLARCHTISRIVQKSLDIGAHYIIEVIAEQFDRLPQEEKTKTLIHELLHIPKSFGGGFKHHDFVNHKNVEKLYRQYENCKRL